jgi:hypothetical protein
MAILLLLVQVGITSADSPATTTPTTTMATTPDRTGGSIYFETEPPDARIWVDTIEMGTSPFTYYSQKPGTLDVRIQRKGYEDYRGNITVSNGKRVVFYARLTPVSRDIPGESTPAAPLTTATTIRRSTMNIPTPWSTTRPGSPVDPAVVIGAAAIGTGFFVIRRR